MVNELPLQIDPLFALTTGKAITETLATAVLDETQPAALVPVSEYEVFVVGLTVKLLPVIV
jgi:hypothetical protein